MMLKACLNGWRSPSEHPALPTTPAAIAKDAAAVVAAGADALHVHPKGDDGADTLEPQMVAEVIAAVRPLWVMSVGLIGWVARAIGVTLPRSVRLRCDGDPVVVGDGGVRRVRTRVDPRTATRRNRAGQEARRLPRPKEVAEQTR
jgi:hypothetical protein